MSCMAVTMTHKNVHVRSLRVEEKNSKNVCDCLLLSMKQTYKFVLELSRWL